MVWINFNLLKWSAEEFGRTLDDIVWPVYSSGLEKFAEAFERSKAHFLSGEAGIEDQDMVSHLSWIEEEFRQRRAALSAMTLSILAREILSFNEELLRAVKSRCTLQVSLPKRSGLGRQVAEYRGYILIDIEAASHFETAREVVLARNAALHNDNTAHKDYRKQTAERLLDEAGEINFTPALLGRFIGELKLYAFWLADTVSNALPPARER